ncbi:RAMP superfamily CRISPR-associated protein [Sphaerothrix gracilis]|uniref:RAMP superfamily CRISPR-associated protein n=1 Tax=Sphaerothrix gracilis TaxID=3151835 RepID=UPI0031FC90EC
MVSKRPNRPIKRSPQTAEGPEKPYALVPFPRQRPFLRAPIGHHRYADNCYHGTLHLTLKVLTALHVSTGVTALGSDVGSRVPLIKTMVQGKNEQLLIQGSSLKGCIRAIYEAITNSTLAVITNRYRQEIPKDRLPCRSKESLCPASQVFGALDWQGLVRFTDAICESTQSAIGFMPSLYRPRPEERNAYFNSKQAAGRKFYYHFVKAQDAGSRGIPIQQAGREYSFNTHIKFINLSEAQLGCLLIALGQDPEYPIALKLGSGKPIGMGTVIVTANSLRLINSFQNLKERYSSFTHTGERILDGRELKSFMNHLFKEAHKNLIEQMQLERLTRILLYPTDREPPEGMY